MKGGLVLGRKMRLEFIIRWLTVCHLRSFHRRGPGGDRSMSLVAASALALAAIAVATALAQRAAREKQLVPVPVRTRRGRR